MTIPTNPETNPDQPKPGLWRALALHWALREMARRDRLAFLERQGIGDPDALRDLLER